MGIGRFVPLTPREEEMEAAARRYRMSEQAEKEFIARIAAELEAYRLSHPDDWKPDHLK